MPTMLPAADPTSRIREGEADHGGGTGAPPLPFEPPLTYGQRVADRVAAFGGSWPFLFCFGAALLGWIFLNSALLGRWHREFDPYPYILLNLFLSMLAAVQAPVIMMSQNRQAAKDRIQAGHDYAVNLKAELEISELQAKLDAVRADQLHDIVERIERQVGDLARSAGRQTGRRRWPSRLLPAPRWRSRRYSPSAQRSRY
jgi:uncharacterized membrane protein